MRDKRRRRSGRSIGDWEIEIGGEFDRSREKLGGDFAVAGGNELGVGVDWRAGDFMVEVAAELLGGFGGVVGGLGVVGFGGAGEEVIGVCHGDTDCSRVERVAWRGMGRMTERSW